MNFLSILPERRLIRRKVQTVLDPDKKHLIILSDLLKHLTITFLQNLQQLWLPVASTGPWNTEGFQELKKKVKVKV